jgi:hypothetical protein
MRCKGPIYLWNSDFIILPIGKSAVFVLDSIDIVLVNNDLSNLYRFFDKLIGDL